MEPLKWWGYIHVNDSVHVKRYFEKRDIEEANESDFVAYTIGPFYADNREKALEYMQNQ